MHNMNWDDLRILLAVADTGSQSAAALKLGVNQTTISRRLRQLEEDSAIPLLERQRTGYRFTEDAQLLVDQARKIEQHVLDIARKQANRSRDTLQGRVVIHSTDMVLRYLIAPMLERFYQQYPGIDLVLLTGDDLISLSHMEADIAIRYVRSEQLDIVQKRLFTFQYHYFASPDYLERHPVDPSVPLTGHQLLKFEHPVYRTSPEQLRHFEDNEIVLRSNYTEFIIDACRRGHGLMSLQRQFGVHIEGLQEVGLPAHREVPLWLACHRDNRKLPAIRAVLDFIGEYTQDWLNENEPTYTS